MLFKSFFTALLGASAVSAMAIEARQCKGPNANQATLDLVKSFEGWYPNIYLDPVGKATIGYGHLCADKKCSDVPYAIPLSKADGQKLLAKDMAVAQNCITTSTNSKVVLNANQYGALVSWTFNVGCGNMRSSTLLKRLNNGEAPNTVAAEELPKWNKAGGKVLPGLTRRRAAEVTLHKTATSVKALPAGC